MLRRIAITFSITANINEPLASIHLDKSSSIPDTKGKETYRTITFAYDKAAPTHDMKA